MSFFTMGVVRGEERKRGDGWTGVKGREGKGHMTVNLQRILMK